jgi:ATP-binding cassette subfamily B protein
MSSLQTKAFWALLSRSVGFHNNNIAGKLVSDAIDFPQAFNMMSGAVFVSIAPLFITLLIGMLIVLSASWALGLIIIAMTVFAVGSSIIESRYRKPLRARRLVATKAVTGHLADTIVNAQTVKTFAGENRELSSHKKLNDTLERMRVNDWRLAAITGNNRMIILFGLQLIYIAILTNAVRHDPSLLGIGIFAFSFTITITYRLFDLNSFIRNVEDGFLQAQPITEVMLGQPEILDRPGADKLKVTSGRIDFKDVDFQYEDADKNQSVFKDLNLSVRPGEKIGLVGPSGGGKSTLTRLLLRFEDVIAGQIEIDGQNIADVTQSSLREVIAYVPQEPLLFHRPVNQNIAYGKPSASQKEIEKAAQLANAAEFIEQLPNKYDTVVGERGVKLSGGQRQRVAIARAMVKDAPILVLDEATSALDSGSEKLIQQALWKLMEGNTAIVIAHRLSTIQRMDRIIVLDEGKIVEQGSHNELLAAEGLYARLWAHQSGGFLED